jgi:ATP-binding cassette, subfamily B, bacterial HlyB/CyaB
MRNISFRYASDLPLLYENFNLTVGAGEVVAILGPSGCGKSTLAKLLLGFCQATVGQITVDGVDIRHLGANELRAFFGPVPQDVNLFSGTILDNLRAGNPAATLEHAVRAAQLAGIHDTVVALPLGYQTEVGERGVGLSGAIRRQANVLRMYGAEEGIWIPFGLFQGRST